MSTSEIRDNNKQTDQWMKPISSTSNRKIYELFASDEADVNSIDGSENSCASTVWTTPSGPMTTNAKAKAQFTLPELQDDKLIEWDLHVSESLGTYDMIIGRDLMEFLKIDICFSDMAVHWGTASMPFKDGDATPAESYHVQETPALAEASERLKRILDAKYEAADLDEICEEQTQLNKDEQGKLHSLLSKYATLFDETL